MHKLYKEFEENFKNDLQEFLDDQDDGEVVYINPNQYKLNYKHIDKNGKFIDKDELAIEDFYYDNEILYDKYSYFNPGYDTGEDIEADDTILSIMRTALTIKAPVIVELWYKKCNAIHVKYFGKTLYYLDLPVNTADMDEDDIFEIKEEEEKLAKINFVEMTKKLDSERGDKNV